MGDLCTKAARDKLLRELVSRTLASHATALMRTLSQGTSLLTFLIVACCPSSCKVPKLIIRELMIKQIFWCFRLRYVCGSVRLPVTEIKDQIISGNRPSVFRYVRRFGLDPIAS